MKKPAIEARAGRGDDDSLANGFTNADAEALLDLITGPTPQIPRLQLASRYGRLALIYLTGSSLRPSVIEVKLERLKRALETGQVSLRNADSLATTITRALKGDEQAFDYLMSWLKSRPGLLNLEPASNQQRQRRPLPAAVTDYINAVQGREKSPLELEVERLTRKEPRA